MDNFDRRQFFQTAMFGVAGLAASGLLLNSAAAKAQSVYDIRRDLLIKAQQAFQQHSDSIVDKDVMAIADFSAASSSPRFHLLDIATGNVDTFLVAHGKGSDPDHTGWVQSFSNEPGSEASSSGSFITGETYFGQHGESRRLIGLDPENNQAENRAIVIHSAWYVSDTIAQEQGKIGRSQGCFAVSENDIGIVLARLGTGRLLFADKIA